MMLFLFGSSDSIPRNQIGWTNRRWIRALLDRAQPEYVVHGASPKRGADSIADEEATLYFAAQGMDPKKHVLRCPIDHTRDGSWDQGCGHRRTERMYREYPLTHGAGFIVGKRGTRHSAGSATSVRLCNHGQPPIPLLVVRDDGIELPQLPDEKWSKHGPIGVDLWNAQLVLAKLTTAGLTTWLPTTQALLSALEMEEKRAPMPEVLAAVAMARAELAGLIATESRISPWLRVVDGLLGKWAPCAP